MFRDLSSRIAAKARSAASSLWRRLKRVPSALFRLSLYLVYIFVAAGIYATLGHFLQAKQYAPLAAVGGSVVAVLFAFTSLLYNRARSFPEGPVQRRSLYAAERSLAACVTFIFSLAVGGVAAMLSATLPEVGNPSVRPTLNVAVVVLYFVSILLALSAYASLFIGIRAIAIKLPYRRTARQYIRR